MLCEGGEILWDIADLITEEHIRAQIQMVANLMYVSLR